MSDRFEPTSSSPSFGMLAGTALGLLFANGLYQGASAQTAQSNAEQLPTIPVDGAAAGTDGYQVTLPSLDKLTSPVVDTPQTITSIPKQLMDDEAVTTMRDALRNVPGVSLAAGEGGQQGDNLSIRGFNAQNDFYLDGMRDFGSYYRDPFNLENIEVLEGPSSTLFGRGSPGGVINQVSKQAKLTPNTDATVQLGTDGLYRFTSDVDRPIEGLPGAAVRLNVMGDLNGTPGRDVAEARRFGFAPELALGLGTNTRFYLDFYHLQSYDTPDYGIPWMNGKPAPVSQSNYYGFADQDFFRTNVNIVTAKLEHDFNDNLTVADQIRFGSYNRDMLVTEPQILKQGPANNFVYAGTPLSAINVSRNDIAVQSTETTLDNDFHGTWHAGEGFIKNTLVAGFEADRQTSEPTRYSYTATLTNLLNPNSQAAFPGNASIKSISKATVDNLAPYFTDTVSLGKYVDLIGGWRWDVFDSTFRQTYPTTVNLSRNDELASWRGAVVIKPTDYGSVYFDYGTAFVPSAESLSLSAATAAVAPEKFTTYEVGTKWDVLNRRLSLTGSVYQIDEANALETDPNDATQDILAGHYRVRGFQAGATGHITPDWEVYGGYAYNDGTVVSSPNANEVGHAIPNAPRNTVSLFTSYNLPAFWGLNRFEVGGGLNYVSQRTASSTPVSGTNTIETAPGYVTGQLMVKYPVNDKWSTQLNVTNVSNTYYYDELHPGHVIVGPARAAMLTVAAKF